MMDVFQSVLEPSPDADRHKVIVGLWQMTNWHTNKAVQSCAVNVICCCRGCEISSTTTNILYSAIDWWWSCGICLRYCGRDIILQPIRNSTLPHSGKSRVQHNELVSSGRRMIISETWFLGGFNRSDSVPLALQHRKHFSGNMTQEHRDQNDLADGTARKNTETATRDGIPRKHRLPGKRSRLNAFKALFLGCSNQVQVASERRNRWLKNQPSEADVYFFSWVLVFHFRIASFWGGKLLRLTGVLLHDALLRYDNTGYILAGLIPKARNSLR